MTAAPVFGGCTRGRLRIVTTGVLRDGCGTTVQTGPPALSESKQCLEHETLLRASTEAVCRTRLWPQVVEVPPLLRIFTRSLHGRHSYRQNRTKSPSHSSGRGFDRGSVGASTRRDRQQKTKVYAGFDGAQIIIASQAGIFRPQGIVHDRNGKARLSMSAFGRNSVARLGSRYLPGSAPAIPNQPTAARTIHGIVKSGSMPIPGAAVSISPSSSDQRFSAWTDVDGSYSVAVPSDGSYTVRVQMVAFANNTQNDCD